MKGNLLIALVILSGNAFAQVQIGQTYQGGVIAYIYQPGDSGYVSWETRGMIAASQDIGIAAWGCIGTALNGPLASTINTFGTQIGYGKLNTDSIIIECTQSGIAAEVCDQYISQGYDDWFLPSRDELYKVYVNRTAIGGFLNGNYWSSTQDDIPNGNSSIYAWRIDFGTGIMHTTGSNKTNLYNVRPIRYFSSCNSAPVATISAYGNTSFCTGADVYLVASPATGVTYQWQKNNVNISNAKTKTYTAKTTGAYRCMVTNACGTSTSNSISVTAMPLTTVTISTTTATTFCAGGSVTFNSTNAGVGYTYQWYKGSVSINGATGLSYTAYSPGSYKVVNTNTANGCARMSSAKSVVVNCRMANPELFTGSMSPENDFLSIYPNPASASFTLELNDEQNTDGIAEIELFNTMGQSVLRLKDEMMDGHMDKVIELKKLNGLHIVKVTVNGKIYDSKVMIN